LYISKRVGVLELAFYRWQLLAAVALAVTLSTVLYLELLDRHLALPLSVVSALGTAISFFVAFFTAQAYDRWWEARKVWGSLVNDSRSFARMVNTYFPDSEGSSEVAALQDRLVRRHIAFLYALRDFLREQDTGEHTRYLAAKDGARIQGQNHTPNALLELQNADIDAAERAGWIEVIRMAQLNDMLNRFSTSMGMCERIKRTVFPAVYATMILVSIWIFVLIFPMTVAEQIGYWAMPFAFVLGAVFSLVYSAGRALLDPFEGLPSDTPMSAITRTIEINLLEQIGESEIPPPIEPIDGRYLL